MRGAFRLSFILVNVTSLARVHGGRIAGRYAPNCPLNPLPLSQAGYTNHAGTHTRRPGPELAGGRAAGGKSARAPAPSRAQSAKAGELRIADWELWIAFWLGQGAADGEGPRLRIGLEHGGIIGPKNWTSN